MTVDRIAGAMTAGAPSAGFTARVMAPIHGRPRPDFTARVMQRIAAAEQQPRTHSLRRRALVLVPAALAVAVGVVAFLGSGITTITTPAAPMLAVGAPARTPEPPPSLHTSLASPTPRQALARRRVPQRNALPELPAIYTIAALEAPEAIGIRPLEPSTTFVPPLAGPAPLKVTDLPGAPGGSRDQKFKETP
jgi:hypothetical protein